MTRSNPGYEPYQRHDDVDEFDELDDLIAQFDQDPVALHAREDAEAAFALLSTLRDHRKLKGTKQKEVAARMGTTQSAVSKLEGGITDPQLSTLMRYARALDGKLVLRFCVDGARAKRDANQWATTAPKARRATARPARIRKVSMGSDRYEQAERKRIA